MTALQNTPPMPRETFVSGLPFEHREAIRRRLENREPAPGDAEDLLAVVEDWIAFAPMTEDDKDCLTADLLRWAQEARTWGPVR